jgi:serine protease Do
MDEERLNEYSQDVTYETATPSYVTSETSANNNTENRTAEKKTKNRKEKKFMPKFLSACAIGLAFGMFAGAGFYGVNFLAGDKINKAAYTNVQDEIASLEKDVKNLQGNRQTVSEGGINTTIVTDVTEVVEDVMPSMVNVNNSVEKTVYDFFGRGFKQAGESNGSGIIIGENDTAFFIATNNHVIEDNVKLTVQFADGSTAEAYVKGFDADIDIAVIAVNKADLSEETKKAIKVANVGDSDSLKMGEPAIAIGNALGYGQSVTTGVISALHRTIDESNNQTLIQTSAAINPGNSGGALLNINGEVIGINSAKIGGDTVEGMGFAIPINDVIGIIGEFSNRETKDKVAENERGYLGIMGLQDDYYSQFVNQMGYPKGAYVSDVYKDSPAERAGIYKGDVITKIDGQTVTSLTGLQELLSYYAGGDSVTLTIQRLEQGSFNEMTIDVTLGTKDVFGDLQNAESDDE